MQVKILNNNNNKKIITPSQQSQQQQQQQQLYNNGPELFPEVSASSIGNFCSSLG